MTRHEPLAVKAQTAAAMLDMPPAEFLRLVGAGALPPPVKIGQHDRWNNSTQSFAAMLRSQKKGLNYD